MTDPVMNEIYSLSEQALRQGQDRIQVHVFPFRMTEANLTVHAHSEWHKFWLNLRDAYDLFERTRIPPKVGICGKRYVVDEGLLGPRDTELTFVTLPDTPSIICGDTQALIPALTAQTEIGGSNVKGRIATRSHPRRADGRNTRRAYAAARPPRMADHARRTRATAVVGADAGASDGMARLHRELLWR